MQLALENERVITNRYRAGQVSFLEVATAQNTTLSTRRVAVDIHAERLAATLRLALFGSFLILRIAVGWAQRIIAARVAGRGWLSRLLGRLAATLQLAAIIGGGWDLDDPVIQSVTRN